MTSVAASAVYILNSRGDVCAIRTAPGVGYGALSDSLHIRAR